MTKWASELLSEIGFYFQDIENWIPAKVCRDQREFFNEFNEVVVLGKDHYQEKRGELRRYFFEGNKNSAADLIDIVFKHGEFEQ